MPARIAPLRIALAGNPNSGKTTLFNALTGSRQRVGNWPGVTVDRMEGSYIHKDREVLVTDLPGIYSFSAHSLDEKISRDYLLQEKPDLVLNIVDAGNLERNLYLTTQLLELRIPIVVALNMMDAAQHRGIHIELEHLREHLGCPVIPCVATRGEGIEELRAAILQVAEGHARSPARIAYDPEIEEALAKLEPLCRPIADARKVDARWLAIKLLENDDLARELTRNTLDVEVRAEQVRIERHMGEEIETAIADGRYGFLHGLARDVVHRHLVTRRTVSDAIDRVALNRTFGVPLFAGVMWLVFFFTLRVATPLIDFLDAVCGSLFVDGLRLLLTRCHMPATLTSVLAEGLGGGLQTVATFIPPIFMIFLCLAFLEDSGYMARGAFVMDRFFRRVGLPGKAFVPMLVGFGCNVPAILSARTLENPRDRIAVIVTNPFISCGARLPVYTLFATVFFRDSAGPIIFLLYGIGLLMGVLTSLLLKRTLLAGETPSFVMELPPYHMPTARGILHHTWHRVLSFVTRAGLFILAVVLVLRLLQILPAGQITNEQGQTEKASLLRRVCQQITPVFAPMGLDRGNWPAVVGLVTGILQKEAVIGALNSLYADTGATQPRSPMTARQIAQDLRQAAVDLPRAFYHAAATPADPEPPIAPPDHTSNMDFTARSHLQRHFGSRAAAFAYMLFVLLYSPCAAAIAAIYREIGSGWALFTALYTTSLAWVVSTLFYQTATFSQHPGSSTAWMLAAALGFALFYFTLKHHKSPSNQN